MTYQIIFSDIDGTLFDHHHNEIPSSAVNALRVAHQKGIQIVLSSGRSLPLIDELGVLLQVPYDGLITCNGALVFDAHRNVIYEEPIPQTDIEGLVSLCKRESICLNLVEKDSFYLTEEPNQAVLDSCRALHITPPPTRSYRGAPIYQALIFIDQTQQDQLSETLSVFHLIRFHPQTCDISAPHMNKAFGIQRYLDYIGLSKDQAIAFGDGGNDIEMLKHVGLGIAMGNASDSVKMHAKHITSRIDDHGIERALLFFEII
jgi:Cof subfamily protein (haloacid dehalogenase superfamily)